MGDYSASRSVFAQRGITLNHLKDELHALNMRMLLALQMHDEAGQKELGTQMAELQRAIDQMNAGNR